MSDPTATPLSNQDFRNLLATPRADRFGSSTPAKGNRTPARQGSATPRTADAAAKAKKPYRPKPEKKAGNDEDKDDDGEPKYRDRAEERRRGINSDYESANKLTATVTGDIDVSKLSVEETKFLGGDMDHTHMVKGLDFALLQKERSKEQRYMDEGSLDTARATAAASAAAAAAAKASKMGKDAMAAAAAAAATAAMGKDEVVKFNGPMARHIHGLLFNPRKKTVAEMFIPRRMAFVFNFHSEEDGLDNEIPTTLQRSKMDCPPAPESVFANIDSHVLERIAKIMSYVKATAGGKKMKKKERDDLVLSMTQAGQPQAEMPPPSPAPGAAGLRQPARGPLAAAAAEEEEDIFGDAGTDYKPSVAKKKEEAKRAASYFGKGEGLPPPPPGPTSRAGDDMDIEDGEMPPPPPLPPPPPGAPSGYAPPGIAGYGQGAGTYGAEGGYGAAGGQDTGGADYRGPAFRSEEEREVEAAETARWRVRTGKVEEKQVDFKEDTYQECYPMQAGFGGEVVDSDDEDLSHMDTAKGKSRYDFTTEEEWQRYKETREQAPKAAFQFGVKTVDGRKGKGGGDKKDGKINSQLSKIERLLSEKGHDHAGAFKKPAAAGKEGGGFDPTLTPARGKRQRI